MGGTGQGPAGAHWERIRDSRGRALLRAWVAVLLVALAPLLAVNVHAPDPCEIQMRIYDGQAGHKPSHADQITRGAFTVLNENDSDRNGANDTDQGNVTGEVDLMKLVLGKPSPDKGGNAVLNVDYFPVLLGGPGEVTLWTKETKHTALPIPLSTPTSQLPRTVWVEGVKKSGMVRDTLLVYTYSTPEVACGDRAKATIVWAKETEVRSAAADAVWADFTDPPNGTHQTFCGGGFGLRPIANQPRGVKNCIGIQFQVFPPGIGDEADVKWDISRQGSGRVWDRKNAANPFALASPQMFPADYPEGDKPNDDQPSSQDNDESEKPNGDNFLYVVDGPGTADDIDGFPGKVGLVIRWNFREFVRVHFDGHEPQGNKVDGSRASAVTLWYVRHHLERGSANVAWTRAAAGNAIGTGNPAVVAP